MISKTSSTPVAIPTACLVVSVVATATVASALTFTAAASAVFFAASFAAVLCAFLNRNLWNSCLASAFTASLPVSLTAFFAPDSAVFFAAFFVVSFFVLSNVSFLNSFQRFSLSNFFFCFFRASTVFCLISLSSGKLFFIAFLASKDAFPPLRNASVPRLSSSFSASSLSIFARNSALAFCFNLSTLSDFSGSFIVLSDSSGFNTALPFSSSNTLFNFTVGISLFKAFFPISAA